MYSPLIESLYQISCDIIKMGFPPSIANATMTFSKLYKKYFKKELHIISKRVFGAHKTMEGVGIGFGFGTATGVALSPLLGAEYVAYSAGASLLASAGDLVGSLVKRRLKKPEGSDCPCIDRTLWLAFFPLLYNQMYHGGNPQNLLILYAGAFVLGPFLHHAFNKMRLGQKYL